MAIPTAPKPKGGGATSAGGSGGSGGSSGGGGGGISGAESRANAALHKAQRKASDKYKAQAKTLAQQIEALKLGTNGGFLKALNARLANVDLIAGQQDKVLMEGYGSRVGDLKGADSDNKKAFGDTAYTNLANRGRERAAAVTEAMNNGSGESDLLKSQLMSLRSWDSNQNEGNRSFFDTLRSVNSSLGDLNADTKTAQINAKTQQLNDRDQLYTQYYNEKSEAYTNIGNLRGQKAELYGLANEQVSSHDSRSKQHRESKLSGSAFRAAERYATRVHKNPGVSSELMDWQGTADFKGETNNSRIENAATNLSAAKKPEGATLRKWPA